MDEHLNVQNDLYWSVERRIRLSKLDEVMFIIIELRLKYKVQTANFPSPVSFKRYFVRIVYMQIGSRDVHCHAALFPLRNILRNRRHLSSLKCDQRVHTTQ